MGTREEDLHLWWRLRGQQQEDHERQGNWERREQRNEQIRVLSKHLWEVHRVALPDDEAEHKFGPTPYEIRHGLA